MSTRNPPDAEAISAVSAGAVEIVVDATPVDPDDGAGPSSNECVICLSEVETGPGGEPVTTIVCGHVFHSACISEWLAKDGRCPTCRRQIQEVQRAPTVAEGILNDVGASARASMHSMALIMLESRRLMMLARTETHSAAYATRGAVRRGRGGKGR